MIQNVSMIGTPEHEQRDGHLRGPEDREQRQAVADELDAAGPREDRGRVEVPAEEPEQRAGEDEAERGDDRLVDRGRQVDQPQRHGGDERDPRRQAVETVDEVDAVDHPDDPEDREARGEPVRERDDVAAERVRDERDADPEGDREDAEDDLAGELPARPEVEEVVDRAERRGRRPADQQRGQLVGERRAQGLLDAERQEPAEVAGRDEDQRDRDERRRDGDAAASRDRDDVDAAGLRPVDHPVADDEPSDDRGQDQRDERPRRGTPRRSGRGRRRASG